MSKGFESLDVRAIPPERVIIGTKPEKTPLENVIEAEPAAPDPPVPHVRKKRKPRAPLAIERVLQSYVVLLNDGRPVIMRKAFGVEDARQKVQALIDAGRI